MKTVLFICIHNSARSQMAEGLVNSLYRDRLRAMSAGTEPGQVHPMAIRAMAEKSIDISGHRSKGLSELDGLEFDCVVTVCSSAGECPFFPGRNILHKSFEDPSEVSGTEAEMMESFRRVRDEINKWIVDNLLPVCGGEEGDGR